MTHIIAGHFAQQEPVEHVMDKLRDAGFSEDSISTFYVNQPGQHDIFVVGGDRSISPGAKESGQGVMRGAAGGGVLGAVVGAAGIVVAGPIVPLVGAMVGAHLGSLMGALSEMKERGEPEEGGENTAAPRKAGMLIAVAVPEPAREQEVVQMLESMGADQIEASEGTITAGDWVDFDPLQMPRPWKPEALPRAQ